MVDWISERHKSMKNKPLKKYKVYLYPNNQPRIFIGEYLSLNKKLVLQACCFENELSIEDRNIVVEEIEET